MFVRVARRGRTACPNRLGAIKDPQTVAAVQMSLRRDEAVEEFGTRLTTKLPGHLLGTKSAAAVGLDGRSYTRSLQGTSSPVPSGRRRTRTRQRSLSYVNDTLVMSRKSTISDLLLRP
jgi:hypothetical protein